MEKIKKEIKYIIADDGEKYPVQTNDAPVVIPAWVSNTFEDKTPEPALNTDVVLSNKPTMFLKAREQNINFLADLLIEIHNALWCDARYILGIVAFLVAFLLLKPLRIIGILATLLMTFGSIFVYTFCHRLKNYSLKQKQQMFVINWHTEEIKEVLIHKVDYPDDCYNTTYFDVNIDNEVVTLCGKDIYFNHDEAEQMLLYVQQRNNNEISKYYPNWKNDKRFIDFYFDRVDTYSDCQYVCDYRVLCDCKEFLMKYITELKNIKEAEKQQQEDVLILRDAIENLNSSL